jgi:nitroimidazol reductase NimA-like FMN-containing flavoprotein (pyridoxamine 5'-phosphate oxidase superfamily)
MSARRVIIEVPPRCRPARRTSKETGTPTTKEHSMQTMAPRVRELDDLDIRAILARNLLGRLALFRDGQIDILPLHYVYWEGSIYGRTSPGGKLAAMDPGGTPVAFEVDEVRSMKKWRSVLIHGTFLLSSDDSG